MDQFILFELLLLFRYNSGKILNGKILKLDAR